MSARAGEIWVLLALSLAACAPSRVAVDTRDLLGEVRSEVLTSEQRDALLRFAPVIFQETSSDPDLVHQDFVTSFDYDGNRVGADNEENLQGVAPDTLKAVVYYSLVETESHRFLTYFLFHPLDWSPLPNLLWLGIWHENDGESLQVVTRKATQGQPERVVLLATQAHLWTELYGDAAAFPARDGWGPTGEPLLLPTATGVAHTHPAVFVESGGHGIYSLGDYQDRLRSQTPPRLQHGLVLRPGGLRPEDSDAWEPGREEYRYRLVSIHDTLWKSYRLGIDQGDGALLDGTFDYADAEVCYPGLPRHFDSDRLSFLFTWKEDSGIVPFAFSDSLLADDLGALFFDPAQKYAQELGVPGGWQRAYTYNPYRPSSADRFPLADERAR
jgi:hypothetical protein